jgi:hypothetical protein
MGRTCSANERNKKCVNIFNGRPGWKRPLRSPMRIWEDNIEMDLKEIVLEVVDWLYLAQDKTVSGLL